MRLAAEFSPTLSLLPLVVRTAVASDRRGTGGTSADMALRAL
jgi:hypothetical protein